MVIRKGWMISLFKGKIQRFDYLFTGRDCIDFTGYKIIPENAVVLSH